MNPIRCRNRLDTLSFLAVFVALALGGLRTWQADRARRPRPSEQLARSLLAARSAGTLQPGVSSRDDFFPAVLTIGALAVSSLLKRFER